MSKATHECPSTCSCPDGALTQFDRCKIKHQVNVFVDGLDDGAVRRLGAVEIRVDLSGDDFKKDRGALETPGRTEACPECGAETAIRGGAADCPGGHVETCDQCGHQWAVLVDDDGEKDPRRIIGKVKTRLEFYSDSTDDDEPVSNLTGDHVRELLADIDRALDLMGEWDNVTSVLNAVVNVRADAA